VGAWHSRRQHECGSQVADRDTPLLAGSVRDSGELTGQLLIERSLPCRVEGRHRAVAGFGRGGVRLSFRGTVQGEREKRYAALLCVMEATASYIAACIIARLRVGSR
jgi:hypothetical protein